MSTDLRLSAPEALVSGCSPPLAGGDIAVCQQLLRSGSRSFFAASLLLPRAIRPAVTAMYAFCRVADDAVDESRDPTAALSLLRKRLDRIYAGRPLDHPVDRAFAATVAAHAIPKPMVEALFEGFEWDRTGRTYDTIDDLLGYCARVASAVGVMMTLVMGRREPDVLARACDLGLAMQLTNICRDVGEDARAGRLYLPKKWLEDEGIAPDEFLLNPRVSPGYVAVILRLLDLAEEFYRRADRGIPYLPAWCRPSIRAARLIYADIGREIVRMSCDNIERRARTTKGRKLASALRGVGCLFWRRGEIGFPAHFSVGFLVDLVDGVDLVGGGG